jgi:DEAD/DEAH box helicase domain-containing protein
MDEIVFDIETQAPADWKNLSGLSISVLGAYSYKDNAYHIFSETELGGFELLLKNARRIIGYNIKHFDIPVLLPYIKTVDLKAIPVLDLMTDPANNLGFRPKLDDLAKATLGVSKSGHGLDAVQWFKEGNIDRLKAYCLDDVKITKDLFDFGVTNKHVLLDSRYSAGQRKVAVSWERLATPLPQAQTSLFA